MHFNFYIVHKSIYSYAHNYLCGVNMKIQRIETGHAGCGHPGCNSSFTVQRLEAGHEGCSHPGCNYNTKETKRLE
jgi:hypothetical protein